MSHQPMVDCIKLRDSHGKRDAVLSAHQNCVIQVWVERQSETEKRQVMTLRKISKSVTRVLAGLCVFGLPALLPTYPTALIGR